MKLQKITKQELQKPEQVAEWLKKLKEANKIIKEMEKAVKQRARELVGPGEKIKTENGTIQINKKSEYINPEAVEQILGDDFIIIEQKKKIDKKRIEMARNGEYGNIHPDQWDLINEATTLIDGNITIK